MKAEIPDNLKADVPKTIWGKILTVTPIIMTVIATALAGLSSSEMSRAQYSRSLAAQQQSKAGDQWGYFQAKRLRGSMQRSTLDLLKSTTDIEPLDVNFIRKHTGSLDPATQAATEAALLKGTTPDLPKTTMIDPGVQGALHAMESSASDDTLKEAIRSMDDERLEETLKAAKAHVQTFDAATEPVNRAIGALERAFMQQGAGQQATRNLVAARLEYTAARYDAEARLNQAVANLHELQVRRSNMKAERHHNRSERFFIGMLGAQAAVIIATFALAAQRRSFLWSLAAAAGAAAVSFAIHVYLFV